MFQVCMMHVCSVCVCVCVCVCVRVCVHACVVILSSTVQGYLKKSDKTQDAAGYLLAR